MSETGLLIFAPGTLCRLVAGDLAEALVLAATVRAGGVSSYEIAWWVNGNRQTAWVEPHEIRPAPSSQSRTIGFRS